MVKKHDLTTCAIYAVNPTIRSPHASSRVGILYPCTATLDLSESRCNKKSRNSCLLCKEIVKHLSPNLGTNQRRIYYSFLQHLKMTQICFSPGVVQRLMIEAQTEQQIQKHKPCIYDKLVNFFPKTMFQLSKYTIHVKSPGQTSGKLSKR